MNEQVKPATLKPEVAAALQNALALLNREGVTFGDVGEAEKILLPIVQQDERNYQALQLLGLGARLAEHLQESRVYYEKSLSIEPRQPHVHFNLANVLYRLGEFDRAVEEHKAALNLKPNYFEAFINMALAQKAKGDLKGVEESYRRALHLQPGSLLAKQGMTSILLDLKRGREAELICRQVLGSDPPEQVQIAAFRYNLGVALKMQGRYEEAMAAFDGAMAVEPNLPRIHYLRGETFLSANRTDDALEEYGLAVRADPTDLGAHWEMNKLIYRRGEDEEFLKSYDWAIARSPDTGGLYLGKANFLFQKEDFDQAREYYEKAARLLPNSVTPLDGIGLIAARVRDFAASRVAHEKAVKMEPENADLWRNYADSLVRAGDPEAARAAIDAALKVEPDHQGSIAMWSTILDLLKDPYAPVLNDFGGMIREFEITAPPGLGSTEDFNAQLLAHLDKLHVDQRESIDQSLRAGSQTFGDLFGKNHNVIEDLRRQIDKAVEAYIADMPEDASHPLFRRKNTRFRYAASWSCQLHGSGYHINHYHPKGWISSAYYVSVPEVVEDDKAKQGWIKFGEPYFDAGLDDPIRRAVKPMSGTLVLFPSYMWHGTIPFLSDQKRTSVAFDVVPA